MCVVNTPGIIKRLAAMGSEESSYVSNVSTHFLTHLIRLAHCPDANKATNAAISMMRLLHNDIFDNNALENKFVTYRSQQDIARATDGGKDTDRISLGQALATSLMDSLDPVAVLSSLFDDVTGDGDIISSNANRLLSVLQGYNPLKLDDIIVLKVCHNGGGCAACMMLKKTLADVDPAHGHARAPNEALLYFLRCMNHCRFDFGGDLESARASHTFQQLECGDPGVVVVPLRNMLLACIDLSADNDNTRTLANISEGFAVEGDAFSDCNRMWVQSLYREVQKIDIQNRAIFSQVYAYMIFSRHRQQSGDCIKQFLYTLFARFLYSATEILFCPEENSSCDVDQGSFISYREAMTNTAAMGSTLFTMKAFLSWRKEGASAAPILSLLTGGWKKNYGTVESLTSVGADMAKCICDLAKPNRLGGRNIATSGLDSIRSIRQTEKYIPFGFVEAHRGTLRLLQTGVGIFPRIHSTGDNIPCNCFHVLPCIAGGQALGPMGVGSQSSFVGALTPGGLNRDTGNVLGLITGYIDKAVLGTTAPANSVDSERRVNKFVRDFMFNKTTIHDASVRDCRNMPHSSFWSNAVIPVMNQECTPMCTDTRTYVLFLIFQRPNVEYPNVSALTASQLELLLSRDPKWADFITRIYFNMERVSFQMTDAIAKNGISGGAGGIFRQASFFSPGLFDCCLGKVFREWRAALSTSDGNVTEVLGAKAQFTSDLYQMLYKIIIEEDMNPSVLISFSSFLRNYVRNMDEILVGILTQ